ncbi:MAG: hypothetical protein M1816_006900 [Peltula sp. TS41687]|nr:MAG: hypothetical protein M1816_006900 [Peltula sp. TS41687]
MSTPIGDPNSANRRNSLEFSDEEQTFIEEGLLRDGGRRRATGLKVQQQQQREKSPSQTREQASRLQDDLALLRAEQVVDEAASQLQQQDNSNNNGGGRGGRNRLVAEPTDDFDITTKKAPVYKPPDNPSTNLARLFKRVHDSSFLVRYCFYITPLVVVILIPLLLGSLLFKRATVGGVKLYWFSIWLEIVWLTLWAGRIFARCIPYPFGLFSSLFTNNSKKWRDMGKQLEVPATIFFWWLSIQVSFLPTMTNNHLDGDTTARHWEQVTNKILIAILVGTALNFAEKIIIQLIAISFHLRTYADRIEVNKFQIDSLTKLYRYSRDKIQMDDSDFEERDTGPSSGVATPMQYLNKAQKNARKGLSKVGDVAGIVAGDFTGKQIAQSTHPHQVVLTLLSTTNGSQVLARRLWRTFAREETDTVFQEDLRRAFDTDDESDAAFEMFDKDLNGDISMEELEAVCVEIGRERKAITASLKDLDSVVSKLDNVLVFIVIIVTLIVFLTMISTSTAGVLTSAGSTILALSWLLSATAQEFLQSLIFVFVKHPFDCGDRVSIYGNTGAQGKGDDYFVKEIALLYTEFKKMEGQVVQAPNSYLNTLFILNMRRSGGLAEAVPVVVKFGTTLEQIDSLRQHLLEFVQEEKREYQGKILTELRNVDEVHSITLNVVFFYKSNWQNELLRLQRRNKFICALMVSMQELGIEGPRMRIPGQKDTEPFYLQNALPTMSNGILPTGMSPPLQPMSSQDTTISEQYSPRHGVQVSRRPRGESASTMSKRMDFSLGMRGLASGDEMSELYDEDVRPRIPLSRFSPTTQTRPRTSQDSGSRASARNAMDHRRLSIDSQTRQQRGRARFFGRNLRRNNERGGAGVTNAEKDLESGVMADIPELRNEPPLPHRSAAEKLLEMRQIRTNKF